MSRIPGSGEIYAQQTTQRVFILFAIGGGRWQSIGVGLLLPSKLDTRHPTPDRQEYAMGLVLIALTGLVWGGIGVVLGAASKRKLDVLTFITVATAMSSVGAWAFIVDWPALTAGNVDKPLPLTLILALGGVSGVIGMVSLQKSMTAGAAAWTVGQSALVIPFLAGILLFGDTVNFFGVVGVATILLSLVSFTNGDRDADGDSEPWLRSALIAFAFLGMQQTLSSVPSSWDGWSDTAGLRVPIILTAGTIPLICVVALRRKRIAHGIWGLSLGYATLVVLGQMLLFKAMDHLQAEGRLSLTFPLALGTCIVSVVAWDSVARRRRLNRPTMIGVALGLAGIVLLAL